MANINGRKNQRFYNFDQLQQMKRHIPPPESNKEKHCNVESRDMLKRIQTLENKQKVRTIKESLEKKAPYSPYKKNQNYMANEKSNQASGKKYFPQHQKIKKGQNRKYVAVHSQLQSRGKEDIEELDQRTNKQFKVIRQQKQHIQNYYRQQDQIGHIKKQNQHLAYKLSISQKNNKKLGQKLQEIIRKQKEHAETIQKLKQDLQVVNKKYKEANEDITRIKNYNLHLAYKLSISQKNNKELEQKLQEVVRKQKEQNNQVIQQLSIRQKEVKNLQEELRMLKNQFRQNQDVHSEKEKKSNQRIQKLQQDLLIAKNKYATYIQQLFNEIKLSSLRRKTQQDLYKVKIDKFEQTKNNLKNI